MKRFILIISSLLLVLNAAVGQSGWIWGKADIAHKTALGNYTSTAVDQYGNTYLCGGVQDSSFPYCANAFVAKYDQLGNLLWYKTGGGKFYDQANSVTVDPWGNVYITGYMGWDPGGGLTDTVYFDNFTFTTSESDIFLAKYDTNGDLDWIKKYGGDHLDEAVCVKSDATGNIYLTGLYASNNYPNSGTATFDTVTLTSWKVSDIFLVKADSSGAVIWARTLGSAGDDNGNSIDFDSSGNVYLCGEFGGNKCMFGSYLLNSLSSGYVAGNIFVAKYDSLGNFIWASTAGGINNSNNTGGSVDHSTAAVTPAGEVYLSGYYIHCSMNWGGGYILPDANGNTMEVFLAKYNTNGQRQWVKGFGSQSDDAALSTATDDDGRVYITGHYGYDICFGGDTLQWKGGRDVFIACFDSAGNHVMSSSVANPGSEYATGIVVKNGGDDIYISGIAAGDSMMFGNIKVYPGLVARNFVAHANKLTGIAPLADRHPVYVYPNPTNKRLYFSGLSERTLVYVYDISGRVVYQQYVNSQQQPGSLNLESLSPGTYIIKLLSKKHVFSTKIILQ
jgi:hypothetical protein